MAFDCEWCFFKDSNNDYCIQGSADWIVGVEHKIDSSDSTVSGIPPFFRYQFDYKSTQSGLWTHKFNLKRLYFNQLVWTLASFFYGLRFETYYWKEDYAFCLNIATFANPIKMTITSSTKVEQCSMVLVTSYDNWDRWYLNTSKLIDVDNNCGLSSNSDITVWSYDFEPKAIERYWFGASQADGFLYNYCFPGPTPFYSYFNKYPNNIVYAWKKTIDALMYLYRSGRREDNQQITSEAKNAHSMEDLAKYSRMLTTRDLGTLGKRVAQQDEVKLL